MGIVRETGFALEAFQRYLELPQPRNLKDLAGVHGTTKAGHGKPYSLVTLRKWSMSHRWAERAQQFDEQVAEAEREALKKARSAERERRERRRLTAADVTIEMAMSYLSVPPAEDDEDPTPKPKKLESLDSGLVALANRMLRDAFDTERLELGGATSRHETSSAGQLEAQARLQQVVVVEASQVGELRDLVKQLTEKGPQTEARRRLTQILNEEDGITDELVVDAEYEAVAP